MKVDIKIYDYRNGEYLNSFSLTNDLDVNEINVLYLKFVSRSKFLICFYYSNITDYKANINLYDLDQNKYIAKSEPIEFIPSHSTFSMLNKGDLIMLSGYESLEIYFFGNNLPDFKIPQTFYVQNMQ